MVKTNIFYIKLIKIYYLFAPIDIDLAYKGFFSCQYSSLIVKPSIVADKCLAGISANCLAPESYL